MVSSESIPPDKILLFDASGNREEADLVAGAVNLKSTDLIDVD